MIEYENLNKVNSVFVKEYINVFQDILKNGRFVLGKNVEKFEKNFAAYCGNKYCLGVASGLDALFLSLLSFKIPKGSEVIVPSNTYIATILAVINAGFKPVMVEPDIKTYNINPDKIEEKITSNTKGIIPVHLFGKPCNMEPIIAIADKYNLIVIEDCAQAHGARYKGKMVGGFGDAGAFSFYPTKNLGAIGDAGAIITNNKSVYQNLFKLRNYGSQVKYYNDIIGFNSRLDEIQAGFLLIKLNKLDKINDHKRKLANAYSEYLKRDFIKPSLDKNYHDVYHIYNLRHPERDRLRDYLLRKNIMTEIHYPVPPHKQKALKGFFKEKFPISEEIHNTSLSLPISFSNTIDEIYRVIEILNKF